jgi:hypothetical protein
MECTFYGDYAEIIFSYLKEIVERQIDVDVVKEYCNNLIEEIFSKKKEDPCYRCELCLDFVFYFDKIYRYSRNEIALEDIKIFLHEYCKGGLIDKILAMKTLPFVPIEIPRIPIETRNKTIYYDFNIYQIIENGNLSQDISNINQIIVYSPIHINEIVRMDKNNKKENVFIQRRLKTISHITKNVINMVNDSRFILCQMDPSLLIDRALNNKNIFVAYEEYYLQSYKDINIYFNNNLTEKHRKEINSRKNNILVNLFDGNYFANNETLKLVYYSNLLNKNFSNIIFEGLSFDEKYDIILGLFQIVNLLSFRSERSDKKIKSSFYDANHVLYASNCDKFITNDRKLYFKAKEIYDFLRIKTKVYLWNDYFVNKDKNGHCA